MTLVDHAATCLTTRKDMTRHQMRSVHCNSLFSFPLLCEIFRRGGDCFPSSLACAMTAIIVSKPPKVRRVVARKNFSQVSRKLKLADCETRTHFHSTSTSTCACASTSTSWATSTSTCTPTSASFSCFFIYQFSMSVTCLHMSADTYGHGHSHVLCLYTC